jgi:hypothetical protein
MVRLLFRFMVEDSLIFKVVLVGRKKRIGNTGEPDERLESNILESFL